MKAKHYIAYFDSLGFESIINLDAYEKDLTWSSLKGEQPKMKLPVGIMIMRAKANPQRHPEIWTFQSEVDEKELWCYAKENPQGLADLIREHGSKVFTSERYKEPVIR
jgi:hypothetical protein